MQEENFTPKYLKELRIAKNNYLDTKEVDRVKNIILTANSENKQAVEISFLTTVNSKIINKYFTDLGFWVGSSGYTRTQHDEDGNEVFWFIYNWETSKGVE